jgi:hypothetical protein
VSGKCHERLAPYLHVQRREASCWFKVPRFQGSTHPITNESSKVRRLAVGTPNVQYERLVTNIVSEKLGRWLDGWLVTGRVLLDEAGVVCT